MRIFQGFEGKKPCIMRFLPRIKLPEVITKPPDFCKMAKRLEISWGAIPRGFESRRLRQETHKNLMFLWVLFFVIYV